ncbi:hypothetical protein CRI77_26690 [Mycolicibacterium duvalii]|uniref:Uncharacterized protein n=1 Tax=Mycolicibacterium duvalii TaxID=39688 RepID=A0A7I7JWV1_9MYCO|nr:hypothetical protein [Mycolicibacterium duvalii]MCV7369610.1 hypothetical protein [Mycolicibacterium duvalii]PEG34712.1 hypothetical protein CRI77_26690 [Mycolicibacterium duvalii]BBX16337.1 hypothetical protein MDUV_11970 [Mycolicibacterium duvalii]
MSTLRLYLRLQAMTFVFGIVGPIFLFIYFSIQPDPTVRWMYWWGLLITVTDILVALYLTDSMTARARDDTARQRSPSDS